MRSRDERKADFERREAIRKERYQASKDARAEKWAALSADHADTREESSAAAVPEDVERLTDEQLRQLMQVEPMPLSPGPLGALLLPWQIAQLRDATRAQLRVRAELKRRQAERGEVEDGDE